MKTKDLLREWKSFLTEVAIIPLSQIKLSMIKKRYSREDIEDLTNFWTSNNYTSKYSRVILNDIEKGEPVDHILSIIKQHYFKVYQGGGPKLKDEISSGNISCDDLRKHLDAKTTFNKSEIRQQCSYENNRPVVGIYQDFDVIYSESDWIVIEPKTIQGSIAWTHGKPDGSEETDQARRSGWCTGVTTGNNMFPNYAGNLHMFYFISADYETNRTPNRRICVSFEVKDGEAYITNKSDAVVDANNNPLNNLLKEKIKKSNPYREIVEKIKDRKDTSFSEIYSKATLSQIIRAIQQLKQNASKEDFERELKAYILHTEKLNVLEYFYNSSYLEKKGLVISRSLESNIDPDFVIANKVLDNNKESEIDHLARSFSDNSSSAFNILSRIVKSSFKWPKVTLSKNRNIVSDKVLNMLLEENDDDINVGVMERIDINSKLCQNIAFSTDDIRIMHSLVIRDDCTEEILFHFIDKCKKDSSGFYKRIVYALIKNKNCTSSMIENIYDFYRDSNDYFLIKDIARSHLCPKEILNDIALNNSQSTIDRIIALNPTCDSRTLRNFYYNTNDSILRKNALENENIEKEILVSQINKPLINFDEIISILSNPNTPPEIIERFILQKSYIAKLERYSSKDEDDYEDDYEDEFNDIFFKSFLKIIFNKNFESFSSKVKSILNKKIDDFAKELSTYDFSMETFIDTFISISYYCTKSTSQNASKRIFFSPGVQKINVEWEYANSFFNNDSFHKDVVNYIYNSVLDSGEFAYTSHVIKDERFSDSLIPKVIQDLRNNRGNYDSYNYDIVTKFLAKKGIQIEDDTINENKKTKKYSLKSIYSNLI